MASPINLTRSKVVPIVQGISGIGASAVTFIKQGTTGTLPGETASFLFGLDNVQGVFSAITILVEFSPTVGATAYWQTVATWLPLSEPLLTCSSAESGFFRLNITAFTGGTSFDVWGTCSQGSGGGTSGSGPAEHVIIDGQPIDVNVVSGGGSNASVGLVGSTSPTSATEMGSVDRSGKLQAVTSDLRGTAQAVAVEIVDASGNQITSFGSSTVTADIVGHSGAVLDAVLGATKPPNVLQVGGNDGTNAYAVPLASGGGSVVVSGSVSATVSGTVSATQGTSPWVISSGVVTANSQTWTTGVGGTSAQIAITGYNTVIVTFNGSGTISTGAATFEVDDGTGTWFSIAGRNITSFSNGTSFNLTAALVSFQFNVAGYINFRVRNNTTITGSAGQSIVRAQATNAYVEPITVVGNSLASNLNATVTPVSGGIWEVSPTTAANTKTNPFFTEISDGTNTVTTNSTTFTSKFGLDVNVLGTLGTAFTTAGFVDVKGADGNVFVRQTTAANLNATVVGTGTFAVQATGTITATQGTAAANTAPWVTRPGSPTTASWSQAAINTSSLGANIIVAGVGGQTVRVMRLFFVNCDAVNTVNATIQDTSPTSFTGPIRLIAAGVFNGQDSNGEPLYVSAIGKGIQINTDVAVQLSGTVWFVQS